MVNAPMAKTFVRNPNALAWKQQMICSLLPSCAFVCAKPVIASVDPNR